MSITGIDLGKIYSDLKNNSSYNNNPGTIMAVSNDVGFGTKSIGDYKVYAANLAIDASINMVWSDSQKTIDVPFMVINTDLDINTANTLEGWKAISGFRDNYHDKIIYTIN